MRNCLDKFLEDFFHGNELKWRLLRTILQGIIGVLIQAMAVGEFNPKQLIAPIVMCILSPIMAEMGGKDE